MIQALVEWGVPRTGLPLRADMRIAAVLQYRRLLPLISLLYERSGQMPPLMEVNGFFLLMHGSSDVSKDIG